MAKLNFDTANSLHTTHGLHAFAAKCPPQLVKYGISQYSKPGETVLDTMMGSGTTLVEARLMGRNGIGYDLDPLARLIASVKSRPLRDETIEAAFDQVLRRAKADLKAIRAGGASSAATARATPPEFPRRDFWFNEDVCVALALISCHIDRADASNGVRNFLWVAFSSLILSKTSVANARDIVHSRPHRYEHPKPPDVIERFALRVKRMRAQMCEFRTECSEAPAARISARCGDARRLGMREETADLFFTSPPYVTALDYPRAHWLAVAWMQKALGITPEQYGELAQRYIGSERGAMKGDFKVDRAIGRFASASDVLRRLAETSPRQAKLAQRYFQDMARALKTGTRVLKTGRHAILVVCPSHIRKVHVPTHEVLVEIGRSVGLRLKRRHVRTISERRRVLPYLPEDFGSRMSTEYVLVFQKSKET
jgi:hypothetical protein